MIDWPKVVQDLEKENARLKKDVEQFQMALREQVELTKNLSGKDMPTIAYISGVAEGLSKMREFGLQVARITRNCCYIDKTKELTMQDLEQIVDEVMKG